MANTTGALDHGGEFGAHLTEAEQRALRGPLPIAGSPASALADEGR
jgi:hypothetical protein